MEQVIKCGELPISKLLFICGAELQTDLLHQQMNSLYTTVKLLGEFRYIIRSVTVGAEEDPALSTTTEAIDNANKEIDLSLFNIPAIDVNELVERIKARENGNVDDFPDAEVGFKVNLKRFQEARRNQIILSALEKKYKPIVDSKLFEVMLDLGFSKYPWEKESTPVSLNEIADVIRKAIGDTPLIKFIDEHFEILGWYNINIHF